MSDFNWCHGPQCHEKHTVDRVRGVKGSKVLRTRKIKINNWNRNSHGPFFVVIIVKMICLENIATQDRCYCTEDRVPRNTYQ